MAQAASWDNLQNWYSDPQVLCLYDAFASSEIVRQLRQDYIEFVRCCCSAKGLRLLELGTGPGHHLEHLLNAAQNWPLQRLDIIGVDLSSCCLESAAGRVARAAEGLPFPVTFMPIRASFAELPWHTLPQVDAAASSLALHHLPGMQKLSFLESLAAHGVNSVFIGEVDALTDLLPQGDRELAYNTYTLYRSVFRAVRCEAGLDLATARGINKRFFMPEVRKVIDLPFNEREEYFLPVSKWQELLQKAGFARTEAKLSFKSQDGNYKLATISAHKGEAND